LYIISRRRGIDFTILPNLPFAYLSCVEH